MNKLIKDMVWNEDDINDYSNMFNEYSEIEYYGCFKKSHDTVKWELISENQNYYIIELELIENELDMGSITIENSYSKAIQRIEKMAYEYYLDSILKVLNQNHPLN